MFWCQLLRSTALLYKKSVDVAQQFCWIHFDCIVWCNLSLFTHIGCTSAATASCRQWHIIAIVLLFITRWRLFLATASRALVEEYHLWICYKLEVRKLFDLITFANEWMDSNWQENQSIWGNQTKKKSSICWRPRHDRIRFVRLQYKMCANHFIIEFVSFVRNFTEM